MLFQPSHPTICTPSTTKKSFHIHIQGGMSYRKFDFCYTHFIFNLNFAVSIRNDTYKSWNLLQMNTTKRQRGGKREGAGRPKGSSKLYAFRADKDLAHFIDTQENKTQFIKDCILSCMEKGAHALPSLEMPSHFGEIIPANRLKPLSLPFFDIKVVAGFPIPLTTDEMAQDIELLQMLCPNPDASYLIRVSGNSMIEADIYDGDILIVDKSNRSPSERQAAVCELNGEYTVKHVVKDGEGLWLVPANPDYPKIKIEEGDDFSVWGVVTYVIHKPRW